jgi:hypothetical protein
VYRQELSLNNASTAYDADVNLTNDGRFRYVWDAENRMILTESQSSDPAAPKRKVTFGSDPSSMVLHAQGQAGPCDSGGVVRARQRRRMRYVSVKPLAITLNEEYLDAAGLRTDTAGPLFHSSARSNTTTDGIPSRWPATGEMLMA